MELTVSLLAYGEARNLKILLPQIKDIVKRITNSYEILVIDGMKSQDNTEEVCAEFGVQYMKQEAPYYGGAYRTAIKYARGKYFVILDADGSHDPKEIRNLYEKIKEGYDVVIGSRYMKGARTQDSKLSILMSKCLNIAYRWCLGLKVKDVSNSFRIYKTEQLKNLNLICNNYDLAEEILFKLKVNDPRVRMGEIPIVFGKRLEGESKRNLVKFILSYIRTLMKFLGFRIKMCIMK